jgi:hypothetical protein
MKKTLLFCFYLIAILYPGATALGQGKETFDNAALTATYANGSFAGNNNITWTYVHARNEGSGTADDYKIEGKGIMLRRADEPSSISATIPNGIGNFSVDTRKAFTGTTQRKLELVINGNVIAQIEPAFVTSGADATIIPFIVENINIPGDVQLTLRLFGAAGNQQITLDNISWTAFSGQVVQTSAPTFSNPAGNYFNSVTVSLSTSTPDAVIFYSTVSNTGPWTEVTNNHSLLIEETTTVYAYADAPTLEKSNVVSATYTIKSTIDVPTLLELRQKPANDGNIYRYTGQAVVTFQHAQRNSKYIQDATAAIKIDDFAGVITTQLNIGDKITNITGTRSAYAAMEQFVPNANIGSVVSTGNTISPEVLTLDELSPAHQAQLVKIMGVTFVVESESFTAGTNYAIRDVVGTGVLRTPTTPSNLDYYGTQTPDGPRNITGVAEQFNTTMQITPRSLADFAIPTTSVENTRAENLRIFPNPARQQFSITSDAQIRWVEISDITGKVVFKSQVNANQVQLDAMPEAGIYIIRVHTADKVLIRKLQVQR